MKIKKPTLEELKKIDLTVFEDHVKDSTHKKYFYNQAGEEHYKLLAHIALQLPKDALYVDLGTYKGLSALAASINDKIQVVTYDITDTHIEPLLIARDNIEFVQKSCLNDLERIKKADFIFLDIDPHNGDQEALFIEKIKEVGYTGLILCDDIHLNPDMQRFWKDLDEDREDWTDVGHYSGTGAIWL